MFLTKEVLFSPLCWLFGSFVCLDKELLTDVTLTKLGGRMGDGPKRKPKIFDWIGINEQIQDLDLGGKFDFGFVCLSLDFQNVKNPRICC